MIKSRKLSSDNLYFIVSLIFTLHYLVCDHEQNCLRIVRNINVGDLQAKLWMLSINTSLEVFADYNTTADKIKDALRKVSSLQNIIVMTLEHEKKHKKFVNGMTAIQTKMRAKLARRKLAQMREDKEISAQKAVTIQKHIRGFLARWHQRQQRKC